MQMENQFAVAFLKPVLNTFIGALNE